MSKLCPMLEFALNVHEVNPDMPTAVLAEHTDELFRLSSRIKREALFLFNQGDANYPMPADAHAAITSILAEFGEGFSYRQPDDIRSAFGLVIVFPDNAFTNSFGGKGWGIQA